MQEPELSWEVGTGHDLFLSLHVLYHPDKYGLRGAWAAGVRSRLPTRERDYLHNVVPFLWPYGWVHHLSPPRDGLTVLKAIAATPLRQRLPQLTALPETWAEPINQVLGEVAERGAWRRTDYDAVRRLMTEKWSHAPAKRELEARLEMHARPDEFGELILSGLQAYYDNFFAEEEERILPALEEAVSAGRRLAETLPLLSLLEELSQGLRYETMPDVTELIMAPSFWSTPLIIQLPVGQSGMLFIFGARPQDASLVPGEFVPDALYQALKALADPTRLRILHDLTAEPMSPSKLARRLRLRAPTVVHHLHVLRLARLVHLTMGKEGKRRYAARAGAVETTFAALQHFLESEPAENGREAPAEE